MLESLGCDRMQGFLLAPSADASVVEELVMAGTAPSLRRRGEMTDGASRGSYSAR